jgi:hypothetical protein
MKTLILLFAFMVGAHDSFAGTDCEKSLKWLAFPDGAAVLCKDGCNVGDFASSMFASPGKFASSMFASADTTGAISSVVTLQSKSELNHTYSVTVSYTAKDKSISVVSKYNVVTDNQCLIQSVTRI